MFLIFIIINHFLVTILTLKISSFLPQSVFIASYTAIIIIIILGDQYLQKM